jgi:hypothetical protein
MKKIMQSDYDAQFMMQLTPPPSMSFARAAAPEVEDNEKVKTKKAQMPSGGGGIGPSSSSGTVRRRTAAAPAKGNLPPWLQKGKNGKTTVKQAKWDPDNDGDDDSTPKGDTDHDHWTPGGKQKKSVPGKPMPSKK